ncbi:DUF5916 domain-containing protein [Candidatus Palauibacter sp.]|uniref:DUF5916 domain-containing protein n=1 Tax=Candidatus Palauibacter sp. TaxID=3101350 RepID=UPI003B52D482
MSLRRKPGLPGCRLGLGAVCLIAMSVPASELRAQDGPGQHEPEEEPPAPLEGLATRAAQAPAVDGVLDDAAWQAVPIMTDFIQREPFDGQPASERTEVRLVYDDAAIYVGVWAWDGDADAIIPGDRIRDTEVSESDAILLAFDTYHDYQNAFVFGTTPAGIEYDGQVANEGQGGGFFLGGGFNTQRRMQSGAGGGFNKNWDGSWNVATSRDGEGWYAEFRIPFNTLRYGNDPIWGFNVSRQIRRRNEESFWSAVPREFNLYRLNYAGHLTGLELPFHRLGSVTPYLLGSAARDYAGGQTAFDRSYEFGGEAKLQITQGITLDATYNTDFAQVEVDDQQVNLTRFSLLFPEKRPFFLENAGFFTVGGGGADLFFSRRIGIANGRQVPIMGGLRVSGRAAGFNVGLLQIATDRIEGVQDPNAYSVARVARELPNRSRIGAAFINRDGSAAGDYNRTYAVDGQLGLGEAWTLTGWGAQTKTPGLTRADQAFDATFGLNTRKWRGNLQYQYFGENFNPEVGFLRRSGHNYYQVFLLHNIHPGGIFRELRPHVSYFTFRSDKTGVQRGFEESARLHIDQHWEFQDGMEAHTGVNWVREGLYEPFTIFGTDVTVPVGTYDGWEGQIRFWTNESAKLSFNGGANAGSFLSGSRRSANGTVTVRSGSSFSTSLRLDYNDVKLEQGDFVTTLAGVNFGYFFTPRIYLQSLVQYSTQLDTFSANVRFGWLNTAGTGLFIVYNDIQGIQDLHGPQGRSLILKFSRQVNVFGG